MRKIALFFFFWLAMFSCGCDVVPFTGPIISIGVESYVIWKNGEASAYYATDLDSATQAMKRTLDSLNFNVSLEPTDKNSCKIIAESHNTFKINIKQVEPYVTQIKIRVDFLGDKPYAELIYKKLEKQLDVIDFAEYHRRWKRR